MARVRTRFAPSPTGALHIGSLRTALFAYALAKHSQGDFILRIEDTDKKREVPGGADLIRKTLETFGLNWDDFYIQSERLELYQKAAEKLVRQGHASREAGAIRLKIPRGETVTYFDFVLGKEISWQTDVLQELVLLKSDGFPTYHLAVVVDDHEMEISHVLRGHDWLPSTPIHLLLYRFLDYPVPQIGHLTDILDPAGGKLSKRKGSASVDWLLQQGYLAEAILNFIMLLGWAPKDNRELFTLEEFVKVFDPKGLQRANPVFNQEKLDWFNGHYLREKSNRQLAELLQPFAPAGAKIDLILQIAPLVRERMTKLSDFLPLAGFFFSRPKVDKKLLGKNYRKHLTAAIAAIEEGLPLDQVPEKQGFKTGDFFMDLRIAVTGSRITPPINESIAILGKSETLERLKTILNTKS